MKLNEKINLIRETLAEEIKPINSKFILDNAQIAPKTNSYKKFNFFSVKLGYAFATFLIIAIIIPIALSQLSLNDKAEGVPPSEYYHDNEVIGYAISSSLALIKTDNLNNPAPNHNNELLVYDELPNLNYFLQPINMMLSYNQFSFGTHISDKNEYDYKIVINGISILGEDLDYKIYYNIYKYDSINIYDLLVLDGDNTYSFKGEKLSIDKNQIFQITYVFDQVNEDYLQVTKYLDDVNDSFNYTIVIDDIVVSKNKLTLIKNNTTYCQLEDLTSLQQAIIYKIYSSSHNKFFIDYAISENGELPNEKPVINEEGQINVVVSKDTSIFSFPANNTNIIFENKPNK